MLHADDHLSVLFIYPLNGIVALALVIEIVSVACHYPRSFLIIRFESHWASHHLEGILLSHSLAGVSASEL